MDGLGPTEESEQSFDFGRGFAFHREDKEKARLLIRTYTVGCCYDEDETEKMILFFEYLDAVRTASGLH